MSAKQEGWKAARSDQKETYMISLADLGIPDQRLENERCDAAGITKSYLDLSSLHGLRYIGEYNRSLLERIIWTILVCTGMFFASYFILGVWRKWEESPVFMSVESTSHHIGNIPFPAISICSVNKLEKKRYKKSLKNLLQKHKQVHKSYLFQYH